MQTLSDDLRQGMAQLEELRGGEKPCDPGRNSLIFYLEGEGI